MPKRKKDCVLIKDQKVLMWKNDQGYINQLFYVIFLTRGFYG